MKRFLCIALVFAIMMMTTGCSGFVTNLVWENMKSRDEKGETVLIEGWGPHMTVQDRDYDNMSAPLIEQLVYAIKLDDKEAVKSVFSQTTIDAVDDLDKQIEELLLFIEGEPVSYEERSSSASESWNDGKHIKDEHKAYEIKTTSDVYYIAFTCRTHNNSNEADIGFHVLCLIRASDAEPDVVYWGNHDVTAGIWIDRNDQTD